MQLDSDATPGEKVRALRLGAGLTLRELAYVLGVTETTLRNWEAGRSVPTPKNLKALAKRFAVSVESLGFSST